MPRSVSSFAFSKRRGDTVIRYEARSNAQFDGVWLQLNGRFGRLHFSDIYEQGYDDMHGAAQMLLAGSRSLRACVQWAPERSPWTVAVTRTLTRRQ